MLPRFISLRWIAILIILLGFYLVPGRFFTDYDGNVSTLGDASPYNVGIAALQSFLEKHRNESMTVFVTPFYEDKTNLSGNKNWTEGVARLQAEYNFTLGLEGHSHKFGSSKCNEFWFPNSGKIKEAAEEFRRGFGYYPTIFRAPCFDLNVFDYAYIKILGMKNYGWLGKGKAYHPEDL